MDGRLTPHTRLKEAARAGVPQRRRENRPPLSGRGSGEGQGRKARWVWAQRVLSAELGPAPALAPANICAPHEAHGPRAHLFRVAQEAVCRAQGWAPLILACGVLKPGPQTEAGGLGAEAGTSPPPPEAAAAVVSPNVTNSP